MTSDTSAYFGRKVLLQADGCQDDRQTPHPQTGGRYPSDLPTSRGIDVGADNSVLTDGGGEMQHNSACICPAIGIFSGIRRSRHPRESDRRGFGLR